ncbi:unnamed protein product [Schistosoma haematobium]|nr:unnamed protein product [Schistosoma haematobium]
MNDLSCNSICQLLCCPPLPSKIAAKLAFMPPPPSYKLTEHAEGGHTTYSFTLASYLKDSFIHFVPENMESMKATTKRGNNIAILYMPINSSSKLTFLLSHGNAVDLGLMLHFMYELGSKLNVNIMCYDYSGYGVSSGKPLEKNLYADAECALNVLRTKYSIPLNQIVLYGQSIGTVPTIHLATLHRVAAVVLHSPLMSGLRVAFPRLKRNYCCDVFSNLARTPKIISPTLVIHGTRDEVVNVTHGYRICSAVAGHLLLDPLFIDGAGHNDCELFPQYLLRLTKLVTVELPRLLSNPNSQNVTEVEDMEVESSKLLEKGTVKEDSQADLSSSNSVPVSLNSHGYFSMNGNTVGGEEDKSTKVFFPQPSWNVTSDSISSRLSVSNVCEQIPPDEIVHPPQRTSPTPSLSSQKCFKSVDDTSACLIGVSRRLNDSDVQKGSQIVVEKCMDQNEAVVSQFSVVTPDCLSSISLDDLHSLPSDICDLTLPPPPPPPTNGDSDFFQSSKLLWSLHTQKNGKINTLPRKLTSKFLETEIDQGHSQMPKKVWTLPREFSSEKITQILNKKLLKNMVDKFESTSTSDISDPVLTEQCSARDSHECRSTITSKFSNSVTLT